MTAQEIREKTFEKAVFGGYDMGSVDDIAMAQGYSDLTAVKDGKVYVMQADILSRPGPRIADAIRAISEALNK